MWNSGWGWGGGTVMRFSPGRMGHVRLRAHQSSTPRQAQFRPPEASQNTCWAPHRRTTNARQREKPAIGRRATPEEHTQKQASKQAPNQPTKQPAPLPPPVSTHRNVVAPGVQLRGAPALHDGLHEWRVGGVPHVPRLTCSSGHSGGSNSGVRQGLPAGACTRPAPASSTLCAPCCRLAVHHTAGGLKPRTRKSTHGSKLHAGVHLQRMPA